MRKPKSSAPPQWQIPNQQQRASFTLSLKLLTPLFGGGYQAREVDTECVVRAATVRGHLRFWWRTLFGGNYTDPAKLFAAEAALWGSTAKPGSVALFVKVTHKGTPQRYSALISNGKKSLAYFLFPFQEQKSSAISEATGYTDVEFQLTLEFPQDKQDEIERTLKAWIAFGGIGSRTRRGCGALTVTEDQTKWLPPQSVLSSDSAWFQQLVGLASSPQAVRLPLLKSSSCVLGANQKEALQVWQELARFWQCFRKGVVDDCNNNSLFGKGQWPDYTRISTLQANNVSSLALNKPFLGMPIIFQKTPKTTGFVGQITPVKPVESGRMASPIILKPMALADGTICACVLVLKCLEPQEIMIENQGAVKLTKPTPRNEEPVLQKLQASDVYDAVLKAAQKYFPNAHQLLP